MDLAYIGHIALVVILALIPALIWLKIWKGKNTSKTAQKYMLLAFVLGALSVFVVLFVHYIWDTFPETDLINLVTQTQLTPKQKALIFVIIAAIIEEIAKLLVILFVDKAKNLVKSIHDAIKFGVVAGLGFAFAENIHYFYSFGSTMSMIEFLALFSFRSLITVCGHLIFSGVFGNFYGISKFSKAFATQNYWGNTKKSDKRALTDADLNRKAFIFNKLMIAKGLLYAAGIHAFFNYSLEQGNINNVFWLIGLSLAYLVYLYRKRSGYITLIYRRSTMSHMRDRDKDVVLELLGLWLKQGKYMQVIETSKRLLQKDPNNTLVRLFLSKAIDSQRFIDAYTAIRNLFVPKNYMEGIDEENGNIDGKDLQKK